MLKILLLVTLCVITSFIHVAKLCYAEEINLMNNYDKWYIKYEESSNHMQNGYYKIRLDIYPEYNSSSFNSHYIYFYDSTIKQSYWRLLPVACIFIKVDINTTKDSIQTLIQDRFTPYFVDMLDKYSSLQDHHSLEPLMSEFCKNIVTKSNAFDIIQINQTLKNIDLEGINQDTYKGISLSKSVYVGSDAIDRSSGLSIVNYTLANVDEPVNEDGNITNVNIYNIDDTYDTVVGIADVDGSNLETLSYEEIGFVLGGGEQQYYGLELSALENNVIEVHAVSGGTAMIERGTTADKMYYRVSTSIPHASLEFGTSTGPISLEGLGNSSPPSQMFIPRININ